MLTAGDLVGTDPGAGPVDAHLITIPPDRRGRWDALDATDPVVPAWLRSGAGARAALGVAWRRGRRAALVATVNAVPVLLQLVWWTVRGAALVTTGLARWVWDVDGHPLVGEISAGSGREYVRMAADRTVRQRWRLVLLGTATLLLLAAVVAGWLMAPGWVAGAGVVLAGLLARVGRPDGPGLRIVSPGVREHVVPRITSELIARALVEVVDSRTARVIERDSSVLWASAIRDASGGAGGHVVRIVLPGAATAAGLVEHEQRLASAMGRAEDCVIVAPLPHITTGHADLYILDRPVLGRAARPGPLATARRTSWWDPVTIGVTRLGTPHREDLRGGAWFVGGRPGSGKSTLLRLAAAQTAMAPDAHLIIVNLKGSPDYAPLRPVCHRYICASPESDPTVVDQVHDLLGWLLAETGRRNDVLGRLVEQGRADSHDVTPELSARHAELHPITVIIDEEHRMYDQSDNPRAKETADLRGRVTKACRSVAISLVGATQLAGTESIPPVVTRAARMRGCMTVSDAVSMRQIFGDAGPGAFAASGVARFRPGTILLASETGAPVKVGAHHLTPGVLAQIGRRALALRQDLDLLTGEAAGDTPTGAGTDPADLLRHVLPLIPGTAPVGGPADDSVAWLSELETALSDRDEYADRAAGGWLVAELRRRGVQVRQIGRRVPVTDRESGQRASLAVSVQAVRTRLAELLTEHEPGGEQLG